MKILTYYGGCGIDAIDPEDIVSIRWADKAPVLMKASEVMSLYNKITCEKAIWGGFMFSELIEAHYYIDSDDKIEVNEDGTDKLPF